MLTQKQKELYANFVGPDGKLQITDSMPQDVKDAFKFFNENNINIFELNETKPVDYSFVTKAADDVDDGDDEKNEVDPSMLVDSPSFSSVDFSATNSQDVDLDDLNDIF